MARILIIEPDQSVGEFLKNLLVQEGYQTNYSSKDSESLNLIEDFQPDVLLLAAEGGDIAGKSLCRQVRNANPNLNIILLTSKSSPDKIAELYEVGADDFVSKPIKTQMLVSRIKAQLINRKSGKESYKVGKLVLDLEKFVLNVDGKPVRLTPQEFKLLRYLMKHKDKVVTREMILSHVWGYETDVQTRAVDVYIGYLRDKLKKAANKTYIKTVRGFGYMISD